MKKMRSIILVVFAIACFTSTLKAGDITSNLPEGYSGFSLWDIGLITELQIDPDKKLTEQEQKQRIKARLFEHVIAEWNESSVAVGISPKIQVHYKDGTFIIADRYTAIVRVPNKLPFRCLLIPKK